MNPTVPGRATIDTDHVLIGIAHVRVSISGSNKATIYPQSARLGRKIIAAMIGAGVGADERYIAVVRPNQATPAHADADTFRDHMKIIKKRIVNPIIQVYCGPGALDIDSDSG
jgi:hypothetical protein